MKSINLVKGILRRRALVQQVWISVETRGKNLITNPVLAQYSEVFNPLWFKIKKLREKDRNLLSS
jgi:hypothetical protein